MRRPDDDRPPPWSFVPMIRAKFPDLEAWAELHGYDLDDELRYPAMAALRDYLAERCTLLGSEKARNDPTINAGLDVIESCLLSGNKGLWDLAGIEFCDSMTPTEPGFECLRPILRLVTAQLVAEMEAEPGYWGRINHALLSRLKYRVKALRTENAPIDTVISALDRVLGARGLFEETRRKAEDVRRKVVQVSMLYDPTSPDVYWDAVESLIRGLTG